MSDSYLSPQDRRELCFRRLHKLVDAIKKASSGTAKREDFREEDSCLRDVYDSMCGEWLTEEQLNHILGKEK